MSTFSLWPLHHGAVVGGSLVGHCTTAQRWATLVGGTVRQCSRCGSGLLRCGTVAVRHDGCLQACMHLGAALLGLRSHILSSYTQM